MGLLDDAIREHLELKRLRGADPQRVAHEEHDAFGAAPSGGPLVDQPLQANGHREDRRLAVADTGSAAFAQATSAAERPDLARGASNVGQETVELDMRTVLDEEAGAGEHGGARVDRDRAAHRAAPSDDGLDWETHAAQRRGRVNQVVDGDGETLGSSRGEAQPVEDLLEETPDFLRDTPEEDRLWFEQRPPRDFDFDD